MIRVSSESSAVAVRAVIASDAGPQPGQDRQVMDVLDRRRRCRELVGHLAERASIVVFEQGQSPGNLAVEVGLARGNALRNAGNASAVSALSSGLCRGV